MPRVIHATVKLQFIESSAFASTVEPGSLGEIDVYLIAGQSNVTGYGKVANSACDTSVVYENVLYYGKGDNKAALTEVVKNFYIYCKSAKAYRDTFASN